MPHSHDPNKQNAHWAWLRLQLPEEGVGNIYPSDVACLARLTAMRWPEGVKCDRCFHSHARTLTTRAVHECRSCKRQFSSKTGTIFHRSKIPLSIWFRSAEHFIRMGITGSDDLPLVSDFENRFQLHHPAATRLRRILFEDLRIGGAQFTGQLISTGPIIPPAGVEMYSPEFADWLRTLARSRGKTIYI